MLARLSVEKTLHKLEVTLPHSPPPPSDSLPQLRHTHTLSHILPGIENRNGGVQERSYLYVLLEGVFV
jgi:hypothetical protein